MDRSDLRRRMLVARHRKATIVFEGRATLGPGFAVQMPDGPCTLIIGDGVEFRRDCFLELEWHSTLRIGPRTTFTRDVMIQVTKEVTIGSGCLFANGAHVVDSRHNFRDPSRPLIDQGLSYAPLSIGDDVWVAAKAVINADVGSRAVIGAGSVVNRPIAAWTLAGGVPARPIETFGPPTS